MTEYRERTYRRTINARGLVTFQVAVRETDLFIAADDDLRIPAREAVIRQRRHIEKYIEQKPQFLHALTPLPEDPLAPPIVQMMLTAGKLSGVGPMAAVAGAVAQHVARDLRDLTNNIIVENGGDIFMKTERERRVAIFAGESPLQGKVALRIKPADMPLGICTSSATVGPSLSFGRADAVCVLSPSAALADAAASRIGNQVKSSKDIKKALAAGAQIPDIMGIVIIIGDRMGAWGNVEFFEYG